MSDRNAALIAELLTDRLFNAKIDDIYISGMFDAYEVTKEGIRDLLKSELENAPGANNE